MFFVANRVSEAFVVREIVFDFFVDRLIHRQVLQVLDIRCNDLSL